jgi:transposase
MGRRSRYPQELRERAVRMVQEHRGEYASEWAAITSIAGKLGVAPSPAPPEDSRSAIPARKTERLTSSYNGHYAN